LFALEPARSGTHQRYEEQMPLCTDQLISNFPGAAS